jgi:hypothetical protein
VGGGAAVLYSVVVGAVREFWVKTAGADVKVWEIPTEIEVPWDEYELPDGSKSYQPGPGAGQGIVMTWSITALSSVRIVSPSLYTIYGRSFIDWVTGGTDTCTNLGSEADPLIGNSNSGNRRTLLSGTYDFGSGSGSRPGPTIQTVHNDRTKAFYECGPEAFTDTDIRYTAVNSIGTTVATSLRLTTYFETTGGVRSNSDPDSIFQRYTNEFRATDIFSQRHFDHEVVFNLESNFPDWPEPVPDGGSPTPPDPLLVPVSYEVFISAKNNRLFILIKSDLNDDDEEFVELKYQSLVGETLADLGDTADPDDWRGDAVSLTPTAGITAADICSNDYLANPEALLNSGNLYSIALSQTIDSQTLQQRLQTSPDTIAATLSTRTATSGASCTMGTAAESTVQVPSPGRGTVEGITYLP